MDFTARWCSTCQVNKASYTDEVLAAFKKYGIVMMKADKTRTNPAIDQELKNLGRTAVPVNALYRQSAALPPGHAGQQENGESLPFPVQQRQQRVRPCLITLLR